MEKAIDNGFTIYIEKTDSGLTCSGLKSLGNGEGMDSIEFNGDRL